MRISAERKEQLLEECIYTASRSSGPGGQNVNKVNTRVELHFLLHESQTLSATEKQIISVKLANRINNAGQIYLASSVERSQWRNKQKVTEKFFVLLEEALSPQRKRIKTKPTRASRVRRLDGKKQLSKKKQMRKKPEM